MDCERGKNAFLQARAFNFLKDRHAHKGFLCSALQRWRYKDVIWEWNWQSRSTRRQVFFSLSQTAEQLESSETLQKGSEVDKSQQFYSAHKANLAIG